MTIVTAWTSRPNISRRCFERLVSASYVSFSFTTLAYTIITSSCLAHVIVARATLISVNLVRRSIRPYLDSETTSRPNITGFAASMSTPNLITVTLNSHLPKSRPCVSLSIQITNCSFRYASSKLRKSAPVFDSSFRQPHPVILFTGSPLAHTSPLYDPHLCPHHLSLHRSFSPDFTLPLGVIFVTTISSEKIIECLGHQEEKKLFFHNNWVWQKNRWIPCFARDLHAGMW